MRRKRLQRVKEAREQRRRVELPWDKFFRWEDWPVYVPVSNTDDEKKYEEDN